MRRSLLITICQIRVPGAPFVREADGWGPHAARRVTRITATTLEPPQPWVFSTSGLDTAFNIIAGGFSVDPFNAGP
jgi:hypothetical protein